MRADDGLELFWGVHFRRDGVWAYIRSAMTVMVECGRNVACNNNNMASCRQQIHVVDPNILNMVIPAESLLRTLTSFLRESTDPTSTRT